MASTESSPIKTSTRGPVVLRSWSKMVMMIPTLIAAIICGVAMSFMNQAELANAETFMTGHLINLLFLLVLAINLSMLLYDLSFRGFLIIALMIVALVLAVFLLNRTGQLWQQLGKVLSVKVFANASFYFLVALLLTFNLAIAWVLTRFNYWVVENNEIIIHRGFMHEQERHPTAQARFRLIIDDIVEYGLLGAGRLVFTFADDDTTHELATVLFVHKKAKRLDEILGRVVVIQQAS